MREWIELYKDSKKKTKQPLSKVIDKLVVYMDADYKKGISLRKEYQNCLKIQSSIEQTSSTTNDFKALEEKEEELTTNNEERREKLNFYLEPLLSSRLDQEMTKEDFYCYLPSLKGMWC